MIRDYIAVALGGEGEKERCVSGWVSYRKLHRILAGGVICVSLAMALWRNHISLNYATIRQIANH